MDEITRKILEEQRQRDQLSMRLSASRLDGISNIAKQAEEFNRRHREMMNIGSTVAGNLFDPRMAERLRGSLSSLSATHADVAYRISKLDLARFTVPAMQDYRLLADQAVRAYTAHDASRASLERLVEALKRTETPWVDKFNAYGSVNGMLSLQNIGAAIGAAPFTDKNSDLLRASLGDWREPIEWPKNIFTDIEERSAFYVARGFNPQLTDFPSDAFREGLLVAGLGESERQDSSDTEDEDIRRLNAAHKRLVRFERDVRYFIELKLRALSGNGWIKQRVPGDVHQAWLERQERARAEGRAVESLVEYADFTDYIKIITRKDNWDLVFKAVFVRPQSVMESFQRLYPLRIDTMHSRIISQDDELYLLAETRRILRAIKSGED